MCNRPDIRAWQPELAGDLMALIALPQISLACFGARLSPDDLARLVGQGWHGAPAEGEVRCSAFDATGRLVGAGAVEGRTLSYFVDPGHWGRGIATALAMQLCHRARRELDLASILAWVERENRASERVLHKCGFRFAGLQHRRLIPGRRETDMRPLLLYRLAP